ncbi:LysM repeat protein [Peribacillus deserti]|uniref:LysM repeat protein n=1 Tax=Peribacillus deserti TaxID=673318 RepID=A0ABS2QPW5_9BACI|nr:LysM peptidoglycan-binding domain-containing protein [Peribacillus deserti]MBM7694729.1 LysM repeat protein [Peribacillus deserti]
MENRTRSLEQEGSVSYSMKNDKQPVLSRAELHRKKRTKKKWKIKFPLLKFLSLLFILLPVTIYSAYQYFGSQSSDSDSLKNGFETVEVFKGEKLNENAAAENASVNEIHKETQPVTSSQKETEKPRENEQILSNESAVQAVPDKKEIQVEEAPQEPLDKNQNNEYRVVYHTVQPKETVFRISMKYYNSQDGIALIREWNGLSGNEISAGQKLKIPLKK